MRHSTAFSGGEDSNLEEGAVFWLLAWQRETLHQLWLLTSWRAWLSPRCPGVVQPQSSVSWDERLQGPITPTPLICIFITIQQLHNLR